MSTIAPDYLDQLGLPRTASALEIEAELAAQEARCQVLLKIPIKRALAKTRLELIEKVRTALTGLGNVPESFELPPAYDDPFDAAPAFNPVGNNAAASRANRPQPESAQSDSEAIIEAAAIEDVGKLGEIRRLINRWASAIPHHEYLTLGNEITFNRVTLRPIYLARLTLLNEQRTLQEREAPYLGERLPTAAPISADGIAVWDIKAEEQPGFNAATIDQPIPATRARLDCPRCQREGIMWCNSCQSTGSILCGQCQGRYQFNCPACQGDGTVLDRQNRKVDCRQCRATGIAICGYCREGWSPCATCRGSRRITCSVCTGRGELLRSLSLQIDYQPSTLSATILPQLPDYLLKRFDVARYEAAATTVMRLEGRERLNAQPIAALTYQNLQRELNNLVARGFHPPADNKVNNGANGKNCRISRHQLQLLRIPAIEVAYSFEQVDYELWIVGGGEVYCRTSPVQEYDQKLAREAVELLKNNELAACLELLGRAFLHTPNSAASLVVLNDAVKRVSQHYQAGEYYQVIELADQAEQLLGQDLAINFINHRARAVRRMRMELVFANITAGLVAIVMAFFGLRARGEIYAWNVASIGSIVAMTIIFTLLTLLLATRLSNRRARLLVATAASLFIVLASSIFGLILQEEYLARQKREAEVRYGRGDYASAKAAIEPLEAALWAAPRDFELQLMLGRAYVRASYYEKALDTLKLALELGGEDNAETHNELGLALSGKGDQQAAIKEFRRALTLKAPKIYEEAYENLGRCYGLVYLKGGTFMMGRSDGSALEAPAHTVDITPFFIDRFEVTNQQYLEFIKATKSAPPPQWRGDTPAAGTENWPVTGVTLTEARAFMRWRGERDGISYRLPTEAEWEFAARGTQNRRYPWGNEGRATLANLRGAEGRLSSVGSYAKSATPNGIEDLLGNAAEWVDDELKPYAGSKAVINANLATARGGAYDNSPDEITATTRIALPATGGDYHNIGFRGALSATELTKPGK